MAKSINIAPSPRLMEIIGATSFTAAEAIAELVANSLDAVVEGVPVEIRVMIDQEHHEIAIIDNCSGIQESDLENALSPGVDMDLARGPRERKGHFGLGMKTACASLGTWWGIETRPKGDKKEYRVSFDLTEWTKRSKENKSWDVDVEERAPSSQSYLKDLPHGTAIVIRKLRQQDIMPGPVFAKLGEVFKPHLAKGDRILVVTNEGERSVAPAELALIPESRCEIDLKIEPNGQYRIKGWVGLYPKVHNGTDYGFNIYRKEQLLITWYKGWFRAHLMTSRIVGEVHLDFIDANFFKLGVQRQSEAWTLVEKEMQEYLKPVVRASNDYSKGRDKTDREKRAIIDRLRKGLDQPGIEIEPGGNQVPGPEGGSSEETESRPIIRVERKSIQLRDGRIVNINAMEQELQSERTPWDYLFEAGTLEVNAILNKSSLLYQRCQHRERSLIMRMAIYQAIIRFLVDHEGLELLKAKEYGDQWLFEELSEGTSKKEENDGQ